MASHFKGNTVERQQQMTDMKRSGDPRAVEALSDALVNDRDKVNRMHAADLLTQIGDKRAIPALKTALNDRDKDVQKWAKMALNDIERKGR